MTKCLRGMGLEGAKELPILIGVGSATSIQCQIDQMRRTGFQRDHQLMMNAERAVKLAKDREAFHVCTAGHIRPGKRPGIQFRLAPMGADRMFAHMTLKCGEQRRGLCIVGREDADDTRGVLKRDFLPTVVVGRNKPLQSGEKVLDKAQWFGLLMEARSKLMECVLG